MARIKNLHFDGILRFIRRSRKEIDLCADSGAYLMGCVLVGAAVEYTLYGMMLAFPNDFYRQGRKLREHWTLRSLNYLARDCG
jgi:hypothetical protein